MWFNKEDVSDILIYHKGYEDWYTSYHVIDADFAENENRIFRSGLMYAFDFATVNDIYEITLRYLSDVEAFINPLVRIDYTNLEKIDHGDGEYLFLKGDIVVDRMLLMENGCYVSLFQLLLYLSSMYTNFGNGLITHLKQFGDSSLSIDHPLVTSLCVDSKLLYYALRAVARKLPRVLGDGYVVGLKNQRIDLVNSNPVVYVGAMLSDSKVVYGDYNIMTRALALYYLIDDVPQCSKKSFFKLGAVNTDYHSFNDERDYVDTIEFEFTREKICHHGGLYGTNGDAIDEDVPEQVDHKALEMDYRVLSEEVVPEKLEVLTPIVGGSKAVSYVAKVHDGQVKNLMAYLEFLNYYGADLNTVKVVYVVGCGSTSYMYSFLGAYFYDKKSSIH